MVDITQLMDIEHGHLSGEIFKSEEIYQMELEKVWKRAWNFLAHDSMIPNKGSFMQNYIGEDPIMIVRLKDGSVAAWLNQCRHRGMRICRADRGTNRAFTCTFHGWAYDLNGDLTMVPRREACYPPDFKLEEWGPIKVPRLQNYKGFWFGTWDESAPDFEEYLGSAKYYIDGYLDRWEGGMEAVAHHRWVLPNNWKYMAEQPTSDMQHSEITHASAALMVNKLGFWADRSKRGDNPVGRQFFSQYGHGGAWYGLKNEEVPNTNQLLDAWERTPEVAASIKARLGDWREVRGHINIWPTFMTLGNHVLRVTHPRGPNEQELWSWAMVPAAAPPEVKDAIRQDILKTFTPSGMFEADDALNWEEMQHILKGRVARDAGFTYQMTGAPIQYDFPFPDGSGCYPGGTTAHVFSDVAALNMYSNYLDMMTTDTWDELRAKREAHAPKATA
jgi:phenylpropionate dioxygenase-like ring-hydroxylating dioxygenase large terminal subunit